MKRIFISIISFLTMVSVQGQTSTLLDRTQYSLSPPETGYNQYLGMNTKKQQQLYSNPAFYELLYRNPSILQTGKYHSILSTSYSQGEQKGDFLPGEGNDFFDYRIMGNGELSISNAGTLFGSIQYARGEHRNIGWNTVRYPDLYQPYITTDSLGGDFIYEDYKATGGYSFRLNDYYLGVYGKFHGEQAYQKTDPRAVNNTTWLGLGFGIAKLYNKHLFMFQAGYERNKQHITLRYWRPGEQDRFFVTYGFGLYDVHQSTIAFGYSRMYYINQGNAALSYMSPQDKSISFYFNLGYNYRRMQTEESSAALNLYYAQTHQFEPTLCIDYRPNTSLSFSFLADGMIDIRKGYENIFDRYLFDANNDIYDYRLLDTQQNYSLSKYTGNARLKASCQINGMHNVSLLGGVSLFSREEKYNSDYKISNQAIHPHAGIGYRMNHKRSELELNATYIHKQLLDNKYDVDISNTTIEHMDFQHAFTQYAYYNSTYSSLNVNATYLYHFSKRALGLNLKLMYKNGERDKDTVYTKTIGFDSSAPRISTQPDKHDELWCSASIFYMF